VGDPPLVVPVGDDRETLRHTRQIGQFAVCEAARPIGDKAQHVSGGVNTIDRQGDIVCTAALAKLDQHLKIELVDRPVETPAKRFSSIADTPHRVLFIGDRVGDLVCDHHLHGLAGVAPPSERGAEELRMQRGGVESQPQQRHFGGEQVPGEFIEAGNAVGEFARRAEQPVGDVIHRVVDWALFGRAPHSSDDTNMLGEKRGRSRLSRCVARGFRESARHRPQIWAGSGRVQAVGIVAPGGYCGASANQHRRASLSPRKVATGASAGLHVPSRQRLDCADIRP